MSSWDNVVPLTFWEKFRTKAKPIFQIGIGLGICGAMYLMFHFLGWIGLLVALLICFICGAALAFDSR